MIIKDGKNKAESFSIPQEETVETARRSFARARKFGMGDSDIREIGKQITEYMEKSGETEYRVMLFDREVIKALEYSLVVITNKPGQGKSVIYPVLFTSTGVASRSVTSIVVARNESRYNKALATPYTADEAFNENLHNILIQGVTDTSGHNAIVLDGLAVHKNKVGDLSLPIRIAQIGMNAIDSYLAEIAGVDTNYTMSQLSNGRRLYLDITHGHGLSDDGLGTPKRQSFVYKLTSRHDGAMRDLNSGGGDTDLVAVSGYLETVPCRVRNHYGNGDTTRLMTNVVINALDMEYETLSSVLLGLALSTNLRQHGELVNNHTCIDPNGLCDIGLANIITNIGGDSSGEPLELGKLTRAEACSLVDKMLMPEVMTTLELECFDKLTSVMAVFMIAADGSAVGQKAIKEVNGARQFIVDCAHRLTNGKFPIDYPTKNIFNGDLYSLPSGVWDGPDGDRPLSDVDNLFVLSHSNDVGEYIHASNTRVGMITQGDTYRDMCAIIERYLPDAKVTSRVNRIQFKGAFMDALRDCLVLDYAYSGVGESLRQTRPIGDDFVTRVSSGGVDKSTGYRGTHINSTRVGIGRRKDY